MKKNGFKQLLEKYNLQIRYVISSLASSAIELIIFYLLTSVFLKDTNNIILYATITSRIIGSTINFIINKYWCFQVLNRTLIQVIEFAVLFVVKLYLSYFFVNMLVEKFSINPTAIKIPVDVCLFFLGYVVQHFIIFRKEKKDYEDQA